MTGWFMLRYVILDSRENPCSSTEYENTLTKSTSNDICSSWLCAFDDVKLKDPTENEVFVNGSESIEENLTHCL